MNILKYPVVKFMLAFAVGFAIGTILQFLFL